MQQVFPLNYVFIYIHQYVWGNTSAVILSLLDMPLLFILRLHYLTFTWCFLCIFDLFYVVHKMSCLL